MKKIIIIFLLYIFFVAGSLSVLAAGETTANPNVSGSGVDANGQMLPGVSSGGIPQSTQGSTSTSGNGSLNPLSFTTIEGVLGNIMKYLQGIAGTIAVIFIIIGGIMYMVSGGSKETTERAKKTLICAIAGLAIVLAAPLFYQEIKAVLGGGGSGTALKGLLTNILKLLLSIVGFLAIISMVVGGIWMLTAVGDDDRYELGKKTAGYSILGLIIALSALIIANQVSSFFGGTSSSLSTGSLGMPMASGISSLPSSTPVGMTSIGGVYYGTGGVPIGGTGVGIGNNPGTTIPTPTTPSAKLSPIQPNTKLIRFTKIGETFQLKVNFDNSLAGTNTGGTGIVDITSKATYSSSNSRIFTVDSAGLVTNTYSYKTGDPNPATATVTISYQNSSSTVAVEAIDQKKCVAVNPTDAKPDDKRFPIVILANGFSEQDMDKFKERATPYANINVPPATNENYVVWRSDLPDKDACNIAGAMKVTIFNKGGQPAGSPEDRTIDIYYLSDNPDKGDYKELYGDPDMVLAHEMGHADGKLADEYTQEGNNPEDFQGFDRAPRYNCFRDDTKESTAEKTFNELCSYFKGITPSYNCGSFGDGIKIGCESDSSEYDCGTGEGIKQGCDYVEKTDSQGYKWYRSIDRGLMNDCGYNGEPCIYGAVDEALYSNQLKQMK